MRGWLTLSHEEGLVTSSSLADGKTLPVQEVYRSTGLPALTAGDVPCAGASGETLQCRVAQAGVILPPCTGAQHSAHLSG